jgi:hypothetical protein
MSFLINSGLEPFSGTSVTIAFIVLRTIIKMLLLVVMDTLFNDVM